MCFYIMYFNAIYRSFDRKYLCVIFIINILIILLFSCNHFPSVKVSKKIFPDNTAQKDTNSKSRILKRYKLMPGMSKSYPVHAIKFNQVYYIRHLSLQVSFPPLADINNKAVGLTLDGKYAEAEILFSETLKEDANLAAAYNNLGIICELQNKNDAAFYMYSKACMIEPDNELYRRNFLYFCDKKI